MGVASSIAGFTDDIINPKPFYSAFPWELWAAGMPFGIIQVAMAKDKDSRYIALENVAANVGILAAAYGLSKTKFGKWTENLFSEVMGAKNPVLATYLALNSILAFWALIRAIAGPGSIGTLIGNAIASAESAVGELITSIFGKNAFTAGFTFNAISDCPEAKKLAWWQKYTIFGAPKRISVYESCEKSKNLKDNEDKVNAVKQAGYVRVDTAADELLARHEIKYGTTEPWTTPTYHLFVDNYAIQTKKGVKREDRKIKKWIVPANTWKAFPSRVTIQNQKAWVNSLLYTGVQAAIEGLNNAIENAKTKKHPGDFDLKRGELRSEIVKGFYDQFMLPANDPKRNYDLGTGFPLYVVDDRNDKYAVYTTRIQSTLAIPPVGLHTSVYIDMADALAGEPGQKDGDNDKKYQKLLDAALSEIKTLEAPSIF